MELVYSQKGSRWGIGPNGFKTTTGGVLKLNYIEVPVLFKYLKKDGARGTYLEGGFSYARKVGTDMSEEVPDAVSRAEFDRVKDSLKSNEFNFIGGWGYRFENDLSFGFRYTAAVSPFYKISEEELASYGSVVGPEVVRRMRNYFLTFFASYDFK